MVAASGSAAAADGAAVAPATALEVSQLRAAAARASWRSIYCCPREVIFGVFLSWRPDPLALAVVKPLLYLKVAVERGVIDWADVR